MPEKQQFLSHSERLDYTELALIAGRFIDHGIRKIRLTGGEPLLRRDINVLLTELGKLVDRGRLQELTLTTNGSRLSQYAKHLAAANVKRINVSLDSLNADEFAKITRGGRLEDVLDGIAAAKSHGISIRINMVALKNTNESQLLSIARYCADQGHDLALIEAMPLGDGVVRRMEDHIPLDTFIRPLQDNYQLYALDYRTAGPARYWHVEGLGLRLGLIAPMSKNFCDGCNRLRLTTDGKVFMCLGSDLHVDLRKAIREGGRAEVDRLLQQALRLKPERHDFERQLEQPALRLHRHMNATGG